MIVLDLVLTHHWYDLIESGRKTVEYREVKPYWTKRLFRKPYSHVRFRRGYTKEDMVFELLSIDIYKGENDLNLPEVYRLSLGERIV